MRNADPKIMQLLSTVDPGNQHAVPWMWGTTGLIYDPDKIKSVMPDAPIDSLGMVFKKELAAKFARCGIGILDSWGDIMPMAARYIGQPALSANPAQLAAVVAKLQEIKPYIRAISTAGYYQQLAEGDLCLAIGYSGDAMISRRMIKESQGSRKIDYSFGREMVPFYIDSMVIPADSPNPAAALAFINFVMQPEVSASVTRFIGFATANAAALPYLERRFATTPSSTPRRGSAIGLNCRRSTRRRRRAHFPAPGSNLNRGCRSAGRGGGRSRGAGAQVPGPIDFDRPKKKPRRGPILRRADADAGAVADLVVLVEEVDDVEARAEGARVRT